MHEYESHKKSYICITFIDKNGILSIGSIRRTDFKANSG